MGTPQRVEHPAHGRGTVTRLLDGGRRLLVRFDGSPVLRVLGLGDLGAPPVAEEPSASPVEVSVKEPAISPVEVPATESSVLPAEPREEEPATPELRQPTPPPTGTAVAPPVPPPSPETTVLDARQALEALRVGVVPARGLDLLTVGREREIEHVDGMLERGEGLAVVSGGYGQGKTHLLELSASRALARGWLVARATFDPLEVPPSHPLRLYAALIRGLRYPDRAGGGLRPLLESLGDGDRHLSGDRRHRWLGPALFAVHRADPRLADEVLEFVSGNHRRDYRYLVRRLQNQGYRGEPVYALPDWRTFGQVMAHLLGGIGAWARDAGYGGLLVLLDEAEYLDQLGATSREMARNVLCYLAMATLPESELAFDPDGVYRGGHPAHRRVPARFSRDPSLAVIAAFTPNPALERVLDGLLRGAEHRLELSPVGGPELASLVDGVSALVAMARPGFEPPERLCRALRRAVADASSLGEMEDPRQAARMAVEFWDLQRHAGDDAALEALSP